MNDTSAVFHIDMLDEVHRANFDPEFPWVFETDSTISCFQTEEAACADQRNYRITLGFDPITGE